MSDQAVMTPSRQVAEAMIEETAAALGRLHGPERVDVIRSSSFAAHSAGRCARGQPETETIRVMLDGRARFGITFG